MRNVSFGSRRSAGRFGASVRWPGVAGACHQRGRWPGARRPDRRGGNTNRSVELFALVPAFLLLTWPPIGLMVVPVRY
jgi:hypothetical protein